MSAPGAVLFDVDGTLVDNSYIHTVAWWRACNEAGEEVAMRHLHRLIGMGGDQLTSALFGRERPELSEAHSRHYRPFWHELRALPGAPELVLRSREAGLRVVVASSAKSEELDMLLGVAGVANVVDASVTSADVERTKPAPDIFSHARDAAGLGAARCVAVGDTGWDVEAAAAAGIACVALTSGGWSEQELRDAGAVAVYDDARALLDDFERSPLGRLAAGEVVEGSRR